MRAREFLRKQAITHDVQGFEQKSKIQPIASLLVLTDNFGRRNVLCETGIGRDEHLLFLQARQRDQQRETRRLGL